jgi:TolA-binding protein
MAQLINRLHEVIARLKRGRTAMKSIRRIATASAVLLALSVPAAARQASSVTQADVQRLQDNIYLAERDIQQARSRDSSRATQMTTELDDLRDEVIYLKVKLRKERTLSRAEYGDVRDRIDDLRSRARGDAPASSSSSSATSSSASSAAPPPTTTPRTAPPSTSTSASSTTTRSTTGALEVPSGTELDVRLQAPLNSGTAQVEDRFEATTLVDVNVNGRVAVPAGSLVRGVITAVEPATRTNRTAKMTVSFDQVTVNNRAYPMRGTVTQAIEGEGIRGETGRIATGAGVGAVIGGILGGFKGALLGVLVGGGGITAATEGKEVELPQGAVLRVRLDSPLQIQNAR